MDHHYAQGLQQFQNNVAIKFQLYNSLFSSLPFQRIEKTGMLLSLFLNKCEEGYANGLSPREIIEGFFLQHTSYREEQEKLDLLFRFIQYVERQVVLFDALEDAAFTGIKDMTGAGTLKQLELEVINRHKENELAKKLEDFSVRLVLTAHPTQFYPGTVLGIIHDLSKALAQNDTAQINMYLKQLGKTPFLQKQKPTPYDEAVSLVWYLENVFYAAAGRIVAGLKNVFPSVLQANNPLIHMGFWPGGDRDGNPFVNTTITLKVAALLRGAIIKCYYLEIRRLKRRLTFKGVDVILTALESRLYDNIFIPGYSTALTREDILDELAKVQDILVELHDGLFLHLVNNLVNKVNIFGLHFASLDIRQESSVHSAVWEYIFKEEYTNLDPGQKAIFLTEEKASIDAAILDAPLLKDTIQSISAIQTIQGQNGELGCHRYVISQCGSALHVLEVYGLFLLGGWKKATMSVDIVPLFEMIGDLQQSSAIMKELYSNQTYRQHLSQRGNRQTIMLGFSDGTKDGGYLMANYSIYKAKEALTAISKEYNVEVVFFDGRGGPPARGGGKTHNFYASMGKNISNKQIQLTVQGQTISSNFGTIESAQYNLEQLLHAGISNELFSGQSATLEKQQEVLLEQLANDSYTAYIQLKQHPHFLNYLSHISPVNFYSETNIASRPSKRSGDKQLELKDLRAISYVGAWSQLKQNVTGYYGVGSALEALDKQGNFEAARVLYNNSLFFRTLIDNSEMTMKKCFFPLTAWLGKDKTYGDIWNKIYDEFELTKNYVLKLTGKSELMEEYPVDSLSIAMREKIVLPLVTIQQFAINAIREMNGRETSLQRKEGYEKLVIRSSFGIINAGRNSA